ncbi:MAG: zinc-binding dehydrogenase [Chitinophagales bacterium]|nr:zinc-binding dehydrogenase [Bacteroidota bacterium]MCB9257171.1 zinc-binding dehydrogenase [Chitinophagales bacterium]
MKAAVLVRNSSAENSFEIREVETPKVQDGQVLIKTEGFGLNFADIMARQGSYQDCPPLPAIIGYDVVGEVVEIGSGVDTVKVGDRVTAMTRFGGYAEYAITDYRACAKIAKDYPFGKATALTTQYCTAYYCFEEMMNLYEGDKVLIHAAAGGVGTALVQLAKYRKCEIFGTAGSDAKLAYLKEMGVQHPINYRTHDFAEEVRKIVGDSGIDAIFDPVGGKSVKKGIKLLGSGGRILLFGASDMTGSNVFEKIGTGLGFGIYHPVEFMLSSKAMFGVNMLRIADNRPFVLQRCLDHVVRLVEEGVLDPKEGKVFKIEELAQAHSYLEGRKSMGKVSVLW